jgi:hypothetical protein
MNPYLRQEKRNDLPSTCITTNSFAIVTRNHNQRPINDRRKRMSTQEEQALALKTLHEAIQALKDCGLMTEEEEDE